MLSILSPAKTLDYETAPTTKKSTQPLFVEQAASLIETARELDPEGIQALMGVSEKIAALNHERFMNWQPDFLFETPNNQYWRLSVMFTPFFGLTPSVKTSWHSRKSTCAFSRGFTGCSGHLI